MIKYDVGKEFYIWVYFFIFFI